MEGVSVIIKKRDKYLMLQQARTRRFPLKWMGVSGAVEEGETPEEAALREVKEETGLDIEIVRKAATLKADYKTKELHFFIANWKKGEVKIDSSEANDFGWFTHEQILKLNLMDATREFFEKRFKPF